MGTTHDMLMMIVDALERCRDCGRGDVPLVSVRRDGFCCIDVADCARFCEERDRAQLRARYPGSA